MSKQLDAQQVIEKFGGVRPLAARLNIAPTTVQGWKKRGSIPPGHLKTILQAANEEGIDLDGPDTSVLMQKVSPTQAKSKSGPDRRTEEEKHNAEVREEKRNFFEQTVLSIAILFMMIVFAIGVVLAPEYIELKERSLRVQELESELARVDEKLQTLEQKQRASLSGRLNEKITALQDRLDNLPLSDLFDGRLAELERKYENLRAWLPSGDDAALQTTLLDMQGDFERLEQEIEAAELQNSKILADITGDDLSAAAVLITLNQIRNSVGRNEPFEKDLDALKDLVGDNPELLASIDKLSPYAKNGVLSKEGLREEFQGLATDIVMSELQGDNVSWKDQMRRRLNDIVTVRKEGGVPDGKETQAVVARAQALLDEGDVAGAIAELESLEGPAAKTAQPFIQEALGQIAVDDVYDILFNHVIKRLSRGQKIDPKALQRDLDSMFQLND